MKNIKILFVVINLLGAAFFFSSCGNTVSVTKEKPDKIQTDSLNQDVDTLSEFEESYLFHLDEKINALKEERNLSFGLYKAELTNLIEELETIRCNYILKSFTDLELSYIDEVPLSLGFLSGLTGLIGGFIPGLGGGGSPPQPPVYPPAAPAPPAQSSNNSNSSDSSGMGGMMPIIVIMVIAVLAFFGLKK